MLDMMRRHSQSLVMYFLFGALIVVFAVNFGPGSSSCSGVEGTTWAATVDGEPIRQQELGQLVNRRLDYERRRSGTTVNDADRQRLRQEVVEQLIRGRVLTHEAKRRGLHVGDAELLTYLKSSYGVDKVSFEQYSRWLRANFGLTPEQFERRARDEMLAAKMEAFIRDNVAVTDAELKDDYETRHDRAMVTFIKFDPKVADAPVPQAEVVASLLADDGERVQAFYDKEKYRYMTPMKVRARHILKKLPQNASEADRAKARSELLALKAQLDGGADFAALAKVHSDDSTKDVGGDLGVFARGQVVAAVEKAAFAQKAGEVTDEPVASPRGLHLVKTEEVMPPAEQTFADVQQEVAKDLLTEEAADSLAKAKAEALLTKLRAGAKLDDVSETRGQAGDKKKDLPVRRDTPWILRSREAIPGIGTSRELHAAIFALTDASPYPGDVHKVGRSYYVVRLRQRETPDLAKFAAEKEDLKQQMQWTRGSTLLKDWSQKLRDQASVELNSALFPRSGSAGDS